MKTLNLKLADVLIKILFVIYSITICIGIGAFYVWFANGTAVQIDRNVGTQFFVPIGKSSPIQTVLTVKDIFVFSIPLIIESIIMIYILVKSSGIIKQFKDGIIFNSSLASQIKTIANWIIILVITKTLLGTILELIILNRTNLSIVSTDFLIILLFMVLIYISADIIKKGADLKSENDLTI